jgi:hypothetical protein
MTDFGKHEWKAVAATCTGAAHQVAKAPNQDAYATLVVGDVTALAVADGHGDSAHFRSRHGSRLAVDLAVELMVEDARLSDVPPVLQTSLQENVKPRLLRDWRLRVLDHLEVWPFSHDEKDKLVGSGDDAVMRAYGTTLIAIVATPAAVGFAQIGDGDAVAVFSDGGVIRPLPEDPKLDGIHTTSLSQPDAAASLRVTVLDLSERAVSLALAVTDGFAAPQVDGVGWWRQVGDELVNHLQAHGSDWVGEKLPGWLEEPAQTGGDDTTMGLLLNHAAGPSSNSS